MPTLYFRNQIQVALFRCEIQGQLSDGHWENAVPYGHYKPWCGDVAVLVDAQHPGRTFRVSKDRYDLTSKELLAVIGKRMLVQARLAKADYDIEEIELYESCFNLDGTWRGVPTYEGDYYDKVRAQLAGCDLDAVRKTAEDESLYTMKDLRKDLEEMKEAMRTYRAVPPTLADLGAEARR